MTAPVSVPRTAPRAAPSCESPIATPAMVPTSVPFVVAPSLGLSPLLVKEIFAMIQTIKEQGITILLVEQNANMAFQVADYVYIMENGRFVSKGSAEEMKNDDDVKEFYLGVREVDSLKGYQRYKRKRTWR